MTSANIRSHERVVFSLIAIIGVCSSVIMFWILAQGPSISPDSIVYIKAARNLLAGNGLFINGQPMTHYPPVLPILLGLIGLFTHGDILLAGRLLAALLFGANLVIICFAVQECTGNSLVAIGCSILVFILSDPVITIHSYVLSEAPYIFFSMLGLFLLAHQIERRRLSLLVLISFLIGLAATTRYIGVVLFPVVILGIALLDRRSYKQKLKDIIIFVGLATIPIALWLIRNTMSADTMTNREFALHPFPLEKVFRLTNTLYDFVFPISILDWTKTLQVVVISTLFLLACGFLYRKLENRQSSMSICIVFPLILVFYSLLYIAILVVSISFFDAYTAINNRTLMPIYLALVVAIVSVVWSMSEVLEKKFIWYGFVMFLLISVSLNAPDAISGGMRIHKNGMEYTARHWKESEVLAYLNEDVPEDMKIYSNAPEVIYLYQNRGANMIPRKIDTGSLQLNKDFPNQINEMINEISNGTALIVYFNRKSRRWYLPNKEEIESMFNLPNMIKLQDGTIYGM